MRCAGKVGCCAGKPNPLQKLAGPAATQGYSRSLLEAVDSGLQVVESNRPQSLDEWLARAKSGVPLNSGTPLKPPGASGDLAPKTSTKRGLTPLIGVVVGAAAAARLGASAGAGRIERDSYRSRNRRILPVRMVTPEPSRCSISGTMYLRVVPSRSRTSATVNSAG